MSANASFVINETNENINFIIEDEQTEVEVSVSEATAVIADTYTGDYEFTPTQETQIAPTGGYYLEQDIVINPIPSNYGLITWDGATLTVS